MDSPSRPTDVQRWLRFKNEGSDTIPPFAVIGPQPGQSERVDVVESSGDIDFALRLGRPYAAAIRDLDASLVYINGPQEVRPKHLGRCTQTGMMQALIGYSEGNEPAWGDSLSIDPSQAHAPFYLVPGSGGFKFIDFDGCPQTNYKDKQRSGYCFRIGWIVPTSQSTTFDGAIIKDSATLTTLAAGGILTFGGSDRDNPDLVPLGVSDRLPYSIETENLKSRGFHRIHTPGHYLLSFTARIRSTDSIINANIPSNLTLTCRTNRVGNTDVFKTADQVEALAAVGELDEESADTIFHKLRVSAEDQPADTNIVEGETTEKHRHWQTVSGSTVLSLSEGELLFVYNSTLYELEVSSVSGTLVLLNGAGTGATSPATVLTQSSSESPDTSEFDSRVTSVEVNVGALETLVDSHAATISSHAINIVAGASAISAVEADVSEHSVRIADLETFETSAAAAIIANATDIDALETFQAAATADISDSVADIDSLETFQLATEAAFAVAIADDTYATAAGDEITTASGLVTGFAKGPVSLPSTAGTNQYFLQSNGLGQTTWAKAVHANWTESSGHLVPDTTNIRDIGTSSIKPRNLYLGGNASIDGTLTVAGTNVIPYIASIALVASVNAGNIEDLETNFAAAIADNTYTTSGGDEIAVANGLITGFTAGSGGSSLVPHHVGHRLTPSSTDSYVTDDDTGNTVLYLLPFCDNLARLYTGSAWELVAIPSLSFDISTYDDIDANSIAPSSAYDAFIDYNGGSPQLAVKKWTSAGFGSSSRATALARQDGVLVLSGATDHLYVGSFLTNSSTQIELSEGKLGIWNYYNQMLHRLNVFDGTHHSYNGPYRAWNNNTSLRVEFILGQKQNLMVMGNFAAWDSSPNHGGVQLDATTGTPLETIENRDNAYYRNGLTCMAKPGPGNHFLQCVEGTESGGNVDFYEARLDFGILA